MLYMSTTFFLSCLINEHSSLVSLSFQFAALMLLLLLFFEMDLSGGKINLRQLSKNHGIKSEKLQKNDEENQQNN